MLFFIPGSTPSSKNGRSAFNGFSIASKRTQKWRKATEQEWIKIKEAFQAELSKFTLPVLIGFHFVRETSHAYDFVNPVQTIQDEMVKHELIGDDNVTQMLPVPLQLDGRFSTRNPDQSGVYFKILSDLCQQTETPAGLCHVEKTTKRKSKHIP